MSDPAMGWKIWETYAILSSRPLLLSNSRKMSDPGDGLKNLHQKETYAVLLSRPILFSNSPVWFRP